MASKYSIYYIVLPTVISVGLVNIVSKYEKKERGEEKEKSETKS